MWDLGVSRNLAEEQAAQLRCNLAALSQATQIVAVLDAAGVPSLVLKGPGLCVQAYGGLGSRTFSDLDVLIAPSDIRLAVTQVQQLGYRPRGAITGLLPRTHYQMALYSDGARLPVELHWQTALQYYGVRPNSSVLLARRRATPVGGKALPTLAPIDQVLYLAIHGAIHEWRRLEWLVSFAGFVERNPSAVSAALEEAPGMGLRRVLELALVLCDRFGLFSTHVSWPLPAKDGELNALASHVVQRISRPLIAPGDEASGISWFWIRCRERSLDRAAVLARFAFHPTERDEIVRLPPQLGMAYYLIRPFRLAWSRISRLRAKARQR